MSRTPTGHPTDRELEVLNILWDSGPAPLKDLCAALRTQRPVATTTVATLLQVMLDKRLVHRKQGPRGYLWSPAVSRDTAARGMVGKLVDRVFDGSAQRLVAHLIDEGRLNEHDLQELKKLIAADS